MNAELTQARLQELRAKHREGKYVRSAGKCVRCRGVWPCEQSVILDMALEAERLREVVRVARFTAVRISNQMVSELLEALAEYDRSALAGTEAES